MGFILMYPLLPPFLVAQPHVPTSPPLQQQTHPGSPVHPHPHCGSLAEAEQPPRCSLLTGPIPASSRRGSFGFLRRLQARNPQKWQSGKSDKWQSPVLVQLRSTPGLSHPGKGSVWLQGATGEPRPHLQSVTVSPGPRSPGWFWW